MNWKIKLSDLLSPRKKENNVEVYFQLLKDVILPTFKEIVKILHDHQINANIGNRNDEIVVEYGGIDWFSMKMMMDDGKMKIEFSIVDTSVLTDEPELKLTNIKVFAFEDITEEKIGNEFVESFQPLIKLYISGKE